MREQLLAVLYNALAVWSICNGAPPCQTLDVIIGRLVGGPHHPVCQVLYHLISANKR